MLVSTSGILLIDKPPNLTSAKVVSAVKSLIAAKKVGHAGTLDPLATGLLICCINKATKLARFLLTGEKTYEAVLRLGATIDTLDAAGTVLDRKPFDHLTKTHIEAVMASFVGPLNQQPPIFSAVKHRGKPLYHYARKGEPVAKPPRTVLITALVIQQVALPDIHFQVTCTAGTYIRTLCADIGNALDCGGHMAALRRTGSCGFSVKRANTLDQLKKMAATGRWREELIPPLEAVQGLPIHRATPALREKIRHGRPLEPADGLKLNGKSMKIMDANRKLLAIIDQDCRYMNVFPEGI